VGIDLEPEPGLADNGYLEHDLQALLEAAGEAARSTETALILFIDELQYVEEAQMGALITALHRVAQRQLPVTMVGARLPQMPGRMGRAKSYAERLFDFPPLGELGPVAARGAIEVPANRPDVTFDPAAVDRIVEETHGYPYFPQEWGKHAWDIARESPVSRSGAGPLRRGTTP
jgi:hypothetical protein